MTLKEFIEKNPSAVKDAIKCKTLEEFESLTEKAGITFDTPEKLEKAFDLLKNQKVNELNEDSLDAVSGGAVYEFDSSTVGFNKKGDMLSTKSGKKVK